MGASSHTPSTYGWTSRSSSAASVSGADTPLGLQRRGNGLDRPLDVLVRHVEMGDGAQETGPEPVEQHAAPLETLERTGGLGERDEVRFDRIHVHGYTRVCETFGEAACARMVIREPVDVVVERVEPCSGEDA